MRLCVVNSHPIQYFAPLYAYLAQHDDVDLTVLYLSDSSIRGAKDSGFGQAVKWDVDLLSGYTHEFIGRKARAITPGGFWSIGGPSLWRRIYRGRFDAVLVHGHAYAADHIAISAAKASGAAVFTRGETHLDLTRRGAKAVARNAALKGLYRFCDAFLAIGSANRDFYRAMGAPDERIFLVPYTVDNARFVARSSLSGDERRAIRSELGVADDTTIVLYLSKLQRRKHPDAVLRAAQRLEREGVALALVLGGTGEMESELRAAAAQGGPRQVEFTGFLNQSRMPKVLGAADVFVLPSEEEPWGLIVNEAMCAGLPVIVGEKLGCVRDLVRPGVNGFTVPAGDADAIAQALRPLLTDPEKRAAMGRMSREIIGRWSYEECRQGILAALKYVNAKRMAPRSGPQPASPRQHSGEIRYDADQN
ncbi:Glycosyltransferase [Rhodovulum sp. PH10]|nr:Glycosyltransferase [Rhodovulum sp. PH10]